MGCFDCCKNLTWFDCRFLWEMCKNHPKQPKPPIEGAFLKPFKQFKNIAMFYLLTSCCRWPGSKSFTFVTFVQRNFDLKLPDNIHDQLQIVYVMMNVLGWMRVMMKVRETIKSLSRTCVSQKKTLPHANVKKKVLIWVAENYQILGRWFLASDTSPVISFIGPRTHGGMLQRSHKWHAMA